MARTSSELKAQGWLDDQAFDEARAALGSKASTDQLERWRGARLLPSVEQIPIYDAGGRVAGSEPVLHSPTSPRQVVALERALHAKRNLKRAGHLLWAAGFTVDERYWRPSLQRADELRAKVLTVAGAILSSDRDRTFGETTVSALGRLDALLRNITRRVGPDGFSRLIDIGADIAAGEFDGFNPHKVEKEQADEEIALRAIDLDGGGNEAVFGERLNLTSDFGSILTLIARTQHDAFSIKDFSDFELSSARDDFRNGLKTAFCIFDALHWIYGPNAFGLRTAAMVARVGTMHSIFNWTVGFARLRRQPNSLPSSAQIQKMADDAEKMWLLSRYLLNLKNQDPEFSRFVSGNRMQKAFSDSLEFRKMQNQLRGFNLPRGVISPWSEWQKSSKMISPGLLAMSIGSPATLPLSAILPVPTDGHAP
ncbi:hypothetical protein [Phenylobacterium sp.]|uniref:hypothetical protein n=1 Tax=Phenylobacterium sp. TaxID=1871053 RepID=UPI003BAB10D3